MAPRLTLLVLSFAGLAAADITGLQPSTTTFTFSSSFSYNAPNVVEAAARIDLYETRLTARMAGGPYLFDQIFAVPYGDPGVQIGVVDALLALGSPALVTGPSLVSSLTSLQGTDVTSSDSAPVAIGTYINGSPLIGPGSVRIGDFQKPCEGVQILGPTTGVPFGCDPTDGTLFQVLAGQQNFTTNTHTVLQVTRTVTTTNTFLTSEHWEITGYPETAPVPEPSTLAVVAAGLAGIGWWRRRS